MTSTWFFKHLKALFAASLVLAGPVSASSPTGEQGQITVFAAASLTDVLQAHANEWSGQTGKPLPRFSFGASATMARQIEAGAPAGLFISANSHWVEELKARGIAKSSHLVATNNLVLVVAENIPVVGFTPDENGFSKLLEGRRLGIADPNTAPAGDYAVTYLRSLGVYEHLKGWLAYGQNARQTLRLAQYGGMPAFVYESDAARTKGLKIIHRAPAGKAPVIGYYGAVIDPKNQNAKMFLTYLRSREAQAIWSKFNFGPVASN